MGVRNYFELSVLFFIFDLLCFPDGFGLRQDRSWTSRMHLALVDSDIQ